MKTIERSKESFGAQTRIHRQGGPYNSSKIGVSIPDTKVVYAEEMGPFKMYVERRSRTSHLLWR